MKGIPIKRTIVEGDLRSEALKIAYKEKEKRGYINGLSQSISKLVQGELRLNGLVGMMERLGYKLEIKIIKK